MSEAGPTVQREHRKTQRSTAATQQHTVQHRTADRDSGTTTTVDSKKATTWDSPTAEADR